MFFRDISYNARNIARVVSLNQLYTVNCHCKVLAIQTTSAPNDKRDV